MHIYVYFVTFSCHFTKSKQGRWITVLYTMPHGWHAWQLCLAQKEYSKSKRKRNEMK
jgi:hypothetical protein